MATKAEWQAKLIRIFDQQLQRVFTRQQLMAVVAHYTTEIEPPASLTTHRLIQILTTAGRLRDVEILPETAVLRAKRDAAAPTGDDPPSPSRRGRPTPAPKSDEDYRPFRRYIWGEASPYEVALALRPRSYLSHASAVFMHGLTRQIVRTVYANQEQSAKPAAASRMLVQHRIDQAFRSPPRASRYIFVYENTRLVLLNGKHTNNLEVSDISGPSSAEYPTTKLERTLIDITVRPAYGGGVFEVLDAFRGARERASVGTLIATLRRLDHVYPYHQAIGFYMERAGYPESALARLAALGLEFDFSLAHKMAAPQYDAKWRIYYPEGLA